MATLLPRLRCAGEKEGFFMFLTQKAGIDSPHCAVQISDEEGSTHDGKTHSCTSRWPRIEGGGPRACLAADLARGSGGHVRLLQVYPVPEHRVSTEGRVVAFADQEMDR